MASRIRRNWQATTDGQLFKDTIFWFARTSCSPRNCDVLLEMIEDNGGIVTRLENEADLRIADPDMSKYMVPGSDYISYEFITDFVRNCVKQLPDRHLILPPFGQKTVNQESRRTRSSHTPAEDAALLIYVESHTKDRTGNQIYKVFAESNPRHPWSSWRNRYVKTLLHYPSHQREILRSLGTPAPASVSVPVDSASSDEMELSE
ncbi:hypothetical protein E4U32_007916 [Claviceps aff. humidiphila group G2b]|nr:hypothetical protein E4U32_007916 [Claviceps aff. humidiphila group G2b]